MTRTIGCYVCGQPSRGKRHRSCRPEWARPRYRPCAACGEPARFDSNAPVAKGGTMHRRCRFPDDKRCAYCFEPTAGAARFHQGCQPMVDTLYVFPDLPGVLQRQCAKCDEFWPIGSEHWTPLRWRTAAGELRVRDDRTCRDCRVQRERERREAA